VKRRLVGQKPPRLSSRRAAGIGVAVGDQFPHQRDQVAAVGDGVVQRIEAADQEGADAQVVVVEQGVGHLFGRADQSGRVAAGAGQRRDPGPEALVQPRAERGGGQQPLGAGVGRRVALGLQPAFSRSSRVRSSISLARFQAASSVSASTGRSDRLKRGARPHFAAAARTRETVSRTWAWVSPQSA
jgi:hypothetical protein